jgi:thymidylate synthase (FAD)
MKIIKPYFKIEDPLNGDEILKKIEKASRTCYKSEDKINAESAKRLIAMIIKKGHESCLEHEKITVRIITDRGVTHEIVRHRIASYSQESTRYCNYGNQEEITVILPSWYYEVHERYMDIKHDLKDPIFWRYYSWLMACGKAEECYMRMIKEGASPQEARSVLPNSLKTEIVVTMNLREWRHFFRLRTAKAAHPDMRAIAIPLFKEFKEKISVIFDDITVEE